MEVKSLYIIKRDSGVCLYHHDFGESIFDPHLLSSFIVAMASFFDEATISRDSKARAFEGTGYTLLVENGEWTMGALAASIDTAVLRDKLSRTLSRFEEQFHLLRWVEMDLAVYSRFEQVMIEEFIRDRVLPHTTIRVKRDWEYYTRNPDVIAFLNLLPEECTVEDASGFLELPIEIAMNLTVDALWDRAVTVTTLPRPDDIYQPTIFAGNNGESELVSEEIKRAISQLDGETPLSIAAEKVKTSDIRQFLQEIALLARRREVEQVSPGQTLVVLYSSSLQGILQKLSKLVGYRLVRQVFNQARELLLNQYSWLGYVELEEHVDVEVRPSLIAGVSRGAVSPKLLRDSLRALLEVVCSIANELTGKAPVKRIVSQTRAEVETRFPNRAFDVEWERFSI